MAIDLILFLQNGDKNESLRVLQTFASDAVNHSLAWQYNTPTLDWTLGQVELRSELEADLWLDWRVTVQVRPNLQG